MAAPPFQSGVPSLANTPGVNQTNILNAVVPPEGPKSVAIVLDFTTVASILIDLTITTAQGKISTVQMVWVDNLVNDAPLTIQVQGTLQNIDVPAGCQGWFAVVATNRPKFVCLTSPGVVLTTLWLNVPVAQGYWFPDGNGATAGADPLAFTMAIGGTAQAVWSTTATTSVPSGGAVIKNPVGASEPLYVDIVNAAQVAEPGTNGTTTELAAGQSFVVPPNFRGTVTVNATTTGHAYVAYGVGIL